MTICYYVAKKGSLMDSSDKTKNLIKFLRVGIVFGVLLFIALFIYQALTISLNNTGLRLCKTPSYIAPESLNLVVGIAFLIAAWRITGVLKEKLVKMRRESYKEELMLQEAAVN